MMCEWIRVSKMPDIYSIGKTYAYQLAREFRAQADPKNWIHDGRIALLRKEPFEEWWQNRGRSK